MSVSDSRPHLRYSDIPEDSKIRGFKFLTLQGGGMKWLGYVGVVEELESCGVLSQIEEVAGSSSGSIMGLLLALGYTAQEIHQEIASLNFMDLQDKAEPGWIESSGLKELLLHEGFESLRGTHVFKILNQIPIIKQAISVASVPGRIADKAAKFEDPLHLLLGSELGLWKGDAFTNILSRLIERKTGNPNLTFSDLSKLATQFPGRFRKLHCTGANLTSKKLEYYDAMHSPDMRIVDAIRISACLPGAFKPVIRETVIDDKGQKKSKNEVIVDGGVLENLPDIFSHPPYFTPTEKQKGNPQVLALMFKNSFDAQTPRIKTSLDYIQAIYNAVMEEEDNKEKYRDHRICIDPIGMGAIELDAGSERIASLIESGKKGTRSTLLEMVAREKSKSPQYKLMPLHDLVRRKIALQYMLKNNKGHADKKHQKQWHADLRTIDQVLHDRGVQANDLKRMEEIELLNLDRRKKGSHGKKWTEQELVNACQYKIDELGNVKNELQEKYQQLKLTRLALEFRVQEIATRKLEKDFQDELAKRLEKIAEFQENIKKNSDARISLEAARTANFSLSPDYRSPASDRRMRELESELAALKHSREIYFRGILTGIQGDELLKHFFEELEQDCQDVNFEVPTTHAAVIQYYEKLMAEFITFMKQVKEEIRNYHKTQKSFEHYKHAFERQKQLSIPYSVVMELNNELDKSLRQKTSLIAKINQRLINKKPLLKNTITTVMQGVAFCALVIRSALVLPLLSFGVAHLIRRHSASNSRARMAADRIFEAFKMPDLFRLNKLREFKNTTALLLQRLNDDYVKKDLAEHTYLYRLLAEHLKNTGLKVEEILPKRAKETDEEYVVRYKRLTQQLKMYDAEVVALSRSRKGRSTPENQNLEHLAKRTLELTLIARQKLGDSNDKKDLADSMRNQRDKILNDVMQYNLQLIHKTYLKDCEAKIDKGRKLSFKDLKEYIESAHVLHRKIPEEIMLQYIRAIDHKLTQDKVCNRVEAKHYVTFAKSLKIPIPNTVREVQMEVLREQASRPEVKSQKTLKEGLEFVRHRLRNNHDKDEELEKIAKLNITKGKKPIGSKDK